MSWRDLRRSALRVLYRRSWSRLDLSQVQRRFRSPDLIDDYLQVVFEYVTDEDHHGIEERWHSAQKAFELKRGDCEEYAIFAWHVLRTHGYEARMFAAFTEDDGHAVCIFRENGGYHTICNQGVRRLGFRRRRKGKGHHTRIARRVAEHLYPGQWVCCSYISHFEEVEPGSVIVPVYDWIYPVEG